MRCPHCDYDLRGSPGKRCPECGRLVNRFAEWSPDAFDKWVWGAALPIVPLIYGVWSVVTMRAVVPTHRTFSLYTLTGGPAVAVGIAAIAIGLFVHARWYWSNSRLLAPWCETCQVVALVIMVGSLLSGAVLIVFF